MAYLVMILSLVLGFTGIYIGVLSFKSYTNIVRSQDLVSKGSIIKISLQTGISASLTFFALIPMFGTIAEKKNNWSFQELFLLLCGSILLGIICLLGTMYQIYTSVKYRDLLKDNNLLREKCNHSSKK
jgi:hypothetical protein